MIRFGHRMVSLALALGLFLTLAGMPAPAACEEQGETVRYAVGIDTLDARLKAMLDAAGTAFERSEDPDNPGVYELRFQTEAYAKVRTVDGEVSEILVLTQPGASYEQSLLWQDAALLAAAVGDIPADQWLVLCLEATKVTLSDTQADQRALTAGDTTVLCHSDPGRKLFYASVQRTENVSEETADLTPWESAVLDGGADE